MGGNCVHFDSDVLEKWIHLEVFLEVGYQAL